MQFTRSFVPIFLLTLGGALVLGDCAPAGGDVESRGNPLLAEWDTPFGVPPFNLIQNDDYLPAFHVAMESHAAEIEAIVSADEPPTFENTIVAMERAGADLSRVSRVFYAVEGANSNDTLREVASTIAPELAGHRDDIRFNPELYARVAEVWDSREALDLDPEQLVLLEDTHKGFVRSGAALDEASKSRLREINGELAELSEEFSQNLLKETNAFQLVIDDQKDLAGLPGDAVAAAADGVAAHSIIAVKGHGPVEEGNDGVVEYKSAHIEGVESELVVRSPHSVQGHPDAIREVRRILLEHAGVE